MENALVHSVGDVAALTQHFTMLHEDRALLQRLRAASLATDLAELTWDAAGVKLLEVYRETIAAAPSGRAQGNRPRSVISDEFMNPKVSVVIPTYNRAANVQKGIESVLDPDVFRPRSHCCGRRVSGRHSGMSLRRPLAIGSATTTRPIRVPARLGTRASPKHGASGSPFSTPTMNGNATSWNGSSRPSSDSPHSAADVTPTFELVNHPETRTFFQLAEGSYRHQGEMGVSTEALKLLVRPGGAGMVICLSSFIGRADLIRKTGGFDLKLPYSQDSEFLFRLAMLTSFCYVNRPLVRFDRSPVEQRHVGVSAQWTKLDFWLQDSQSRLEGLLRFREGLPKEVVDLIQEQLGSIHSGWANWYLAAGQYGKAREAISRAMRLDPSFNIAVKWLLTWTSPRLACRAVRYHQERSPESIA